MATIAHKLKGSSANLGAVRVIERCRQLEELTDTSDKDAAAALVEARAVEIAAARSALGEILGKTAGNEEA